MGNLTALGDEEFAFVLPYLLLSRVDKALLKVGSEVQWNELGVGRRWPGEC
jgi:hypothetical protein